MEDKRLVPYEGIQINQTSLKFKSLTQQEKKRISKAQTWRKYSENTLLANNSKSEYKKSSYNSVTKRKTTKFKISPRFPQKFDQNIQMINTYI